jgi:hypothetical protein
MCQRRATIRWFRVIDPAAVDEHGRCIRHMCRLCRRISLIRCGQSRVAATRARSGEDVARAILPKAGAQFGADQHGVRRHAVCRALEQE